MVLLVLVNMLRIGRKFPFVAVWLVVGQGCTSRKAVLEVNNHSSVVVAQMSMNATAFLTISEREVRITMAKKVRGDFRKIGIAILSAVILVCVVSLVLLNDSVKTAYAGEYLEYFYENFDVESPWDSAFSDWESGAKATIVDEGIDGKSLKINGVEGNGCVVMALG